MRPSGLTQQRKIEQAMEHFGLGSVGVQEEKVHIIALVERLSIKTQFVRPIDPRTGVISTERPRELMRERVSTDYYNINDHALIKIPQSYVQAYFLYEYVLDEDEVDYYRRKVSRFCL